MNGEGFEIQLISINFTIIVGKNMEFLCHWLEIMLMMSLILLELVGTKKIENILLLLELIKNHFFIDLKVAAKLMADIAIIITKKFFLLVQFLSEYVKLK